MSARATRLSFGANRTSTIASDIVAWSRTHMYKPRFVRRSPRHTEAGTRTSPLSSCCRAPQGSSRPTRILHVRLIRTLRDNQQVQRTEGHAGVVKLADAPDSKSGDRKVMGVRYPPPAPFALALRAAFGESQARSSAGPGGQAGLASESPALSVLTSPQSAMTTRVRMMPTKAPPKCPTLPRSEASATPATARRAHRTAG